MLNINKRAIMEYPSWYCCWWSAGQTAEIASLHFVSLEQWIQWKWVWGGRKVRWTINWSASVTWHGSSSRTLADRSFLLSTSRRVCTYQLAVGLNKVHHTAPPKNTSPTLINTAQTSEMHIEHSDSFHHAKCLACSGDGGENWKRQRGRGRKQEKEGSLKG